MKKSKSEMKFERVMREFANGKLESHGTKVTDQKQALAIAFSEARKINPDYGIKKEGGGIEKNEGIDLFEDYENIPKNVQKILDKYEEGFSDGDYDVLKKAHDELEKIGYTFEYYLDGTAYDLRKIGEIGKVEYAEKHGIGLMSEGGKLDDIYRTGTAQQLWNAWDEKQRQHFLTDHLDMFRLELGDNPNEYIPKLAEALWNMLPKEVRKEVVIHHAMGIYHEGGPIKTSGVVQKYKLYFKNLPSLIIEANSEEEADEIYRSMTAEEAKKLGINSMLYEGIDPDKIEKVVEDEKNEESNEIEGDYEGGFNSGYIKLEMYKKDGKFSVYDSLNKNKLSPDYSDKQVARAFIQGIEQGLHSTITPKYVKGKFHLVKKDNSIMLRSDRKEVADAYILGFEVAKSGKVSEKNKMHNGGRITPAKKKLQDRIEVLKRTMVSANSTAQKSIQKKIDVLQAKVDHNPSLKEKIAAQKGRFYLDVPTEYAKRIYRQLWRQGIKPRLHKLNGNTKVVVDHATKLNKAYKIYSDILKEKSIPVPALSKIKGKL